MYVLNSKLVEDVLVFNTIRHQLLIEITDCACQVS